MPHIRPVERPARSVLHEMDDDMHEDGSTGLSVAPTLGSDVASLLVRQSAREALSPFQSEPLD